LANVKLRHAIVVLKVFSFFLILFLGYNPMSFILSIPPLNGRNYGVWREKLEMALALSDNDLALTTPCPIVPEDPVREENEAEAAFTTHQRENAIVRTKYDLDHAKWVSSNRKCLIVIKSSIEDPIRGAILECTTTAEYLKKVES
jgi:hypothetical protein